MGLDAYAIATEKLLFKMRLIVSERNGGVCEPERISFLLSLEVGERNSSRTDFGRLPK